MFDWVKNAFNTVKNTVTGVVNVVSGKTWSGEKPASSVSAPVYAAETVTRNNAPKLSIIERYRNVTNRLANTIK